VGRLERYKGLYLLFEALKGLDGMSLVVVGDGGYRGELEKLSEGLDVTFVGFSVDTERYYRSADLFINPSLGPEGLPIVSLESMAYGLPCIFSSLPVHEEISDGGEAALLFRVGDAAHLRSRIAEVRDDAALRERLAFKARAVVEARYSPAAATTAYLRAFDLSSKPHDSDVDHDANLDSIKSR
jgi:glycosyltransferase involved in cell wall biosynthesis